MHSCKSHPFQIHPQQIADSVGLDDGDKGRLVLQMEFEDRDCNHALVPVDRDLGTMGPTQAHLHKSPFFAKWVRAHLDPDPGARLPTLSFMVYRCARLHPSPCFCRRHLNCRAQVYTVSC